MYKVKRGMGIRKQAVSSAVSGANTHRFMLWALLLLIAVGSVEGWAEARKKNAAKTAKAVPARVHFSGNFQGELEPCG
ncbi:MAG: hypothetical protein PHI18_09515 [bacterium]|nr:hypothetical protein [bacterium]